MSGNEMSPGADNDANVKPPSMTLPDGTFAEYVSGTMDGLTEDGDLACTVTVALDGELRTTSIVIPRDTVLANWPADG